MSAAHRRSGAHYATGTLTRIAPREQLEAWLKSAAAGDRCEYAIGPSLGGHASAQLAREAAETGAFDKTFSISQARERGEIRYRIECRGEIALTPPAAPALAPQARLMLSLLTDLANDVGPCPSNARLAALLGLGTAEQARYRLAQLIEAGLVRIVSRQRFGARVIEIVATGARTAAARS